MVTTAIVTVSTQVIQAANPNFLQQSGAFISQGGTTKAPNTLTSIPTLAAGQAILAAPVALTSLVWASSVVTGTTAAPHGWTNGDVVGAVIAGATPAGYNGTFQITITGASTFTYPLVSNPGSETVPGTVTLADEAELLAMMTTYFAGNGLVAPYVLELGEGTPTEGVAALATWITNHPETIYSFLVPREWDDNSAFLAFLPNYVSPNALTYFFVTTTVSNRALYPFKCVLAEVEAPSIPATEFSLASAFGTTLKQNPNSSNRVPPLSYAPAFGVTPYPLPGNQTIFNELAAANVGWIGTGAQGGLPTQAILFQGQLGDGNPWSFWYSADNAQVSIEQALANEIINGSATSLAPLYYDQDGINRLQNRAVQAMQTQVSNGLAVGTVVATQLPAQQFASNFEAGLYDGQLVVNAEPFLTYSAENPSDFAIGKYAGLAAVYTSSRGFLNIFFSLNVTNLIVV